jgi:PPOX class probable F420-dependent enzyme
VLNDKIRGLIDNGTFGMMATVLPSGLLQNQPVWLDYDGDTLLVNTEVERRKFKNLQANPSVTITVMEPGNPWNWCEVRGSMVDSVHGQEARDHIDHLSRRYLGQDDYPNPIASPRVIVKIAPEQVYDFPPSG